MKKNMIVGIALAMGILSVGAISASAADACGKCADKQAVEQFTQETGALSSELKVKDLELRALYGYDSFDTRKASDLEAEIKDLNEKINLSANKLGVSPCNRI